MLWYLGVYLVGLLVVHSSTRRRSLGLVVAARRRRRHGAARLPRRRLLARLAAPGAGRTHDRHRPCTSALCESSTVGDGTRVWAFAHVLPGAVIGADCNICDHVFVENDVVVGDRVTVKCGVQLWDGVTPRGRRLRRAQRDLHQRPVPAQQGVPRVVRDDGRRHGRLDRRQRDHPARASRSARRDGRRRRGRHAGRAAQRRSWSATRRASSGYADARATTGAATPSAAALAEPRIRRPLPRREPASIR